MPFENLISFENPNFQTGELNFYNLLIISVDHFFEILFY